MYFVVKPGAISSMFSEEPKHDKALILKQVFHQYCFLTVSGTIYAEEGLCTVRRVIWKVWN